MKKAFSFLALFAAVGLAHAGGGHGTSGGDPVAEDVSRQLNRIGERIAKMSVPEIIYEFYSRYPSIHPEKVISYANRIKIRTTDEPVKTLEGRDISVFINPEKEELVVQREAYKALSDGDRFSMVTWMIYVGAGGDLTSVDRHYKIRQLTHDIIQAKP